MNLSQVEVIVAIAEAGSISKAAQNLYLSQPSVSKTLQRFEQEVGAQIFERVSTGVRLTPIGRRFVNNARDIVNQLDKLETIFDTKGTPMTLEFNVVSMSYHFMQFMLPELYGKYRQNPISIRYTEGSLDRAIDMLQKGDAEIGIISFSGTEIKMVAKKAAASGLEYHRLGSMEPYIAVSQNSRKYPASVEGLDLNRLAEMPIVSISPSSPRSTTGWDYMQSLFGQKLRSSNQEIRTISTSTMQNIVCNCDGFGLVLLNRGIYERYGFFPELRLIPITEGVDTFELGWLQRANTVRSPLANDFIETLKDYVEDD